MIDSSSSSSKICLSDLYKMTNESKKFNIKRRKVSYSGDDREAGSIFEMFNIDSLKEDYTKPAFYGEKENLSTKIDDLVDLIQKNTLNKKEFSNVLNNQHILISKIDSLKKDNEELIQKVDYLKSQNTELDQNIIFLKDQSIKLEENVTSLKELNNELKKILIKNTSDKYLKRISSVFLVFFIFSLCLYLYSSYELVKIEWTRIGVILSAGSYFIGYYIGKWNDKQRLKNVN